MSLFSEDCLLPSEFDGWVRLFPLPNYVLFPGIVKGLHIFEPRYCAMLSAALASDNLIAMAVLKPGWEADYLNSPPIYESVCIGRIKFHERTREDRHNIFLSGLIRATILEEKPSSERYRLARVKLVEEIACDTEADSQKSFEMLWKTAQNHVSMLSASSAVRFPKRGNCSLSRLIDFLSHELPLSVDRKVSLLAESELGKRYGFLMTYFAGFSGFMSDDFNRDDGPSAAPESPRKCDWN